MKRATYEDVANAPDHVVAELLDGELVLNPRPAARHAAAMAAIHGTLWSRFDGGERRPSGWIVLPEPELHFGATVVVPDVAAWRRERLPVVPDQPWLELAPDWVCEVLSPSTVRIDRGRKLVQQHRQLSGDRRLVVFVDYMQKVPQIPEPENETEKVTFIVNGLKDIALSEDVPMVSIVAADKEGLKASRLRNFHLRGSSAINYEADIILILNEKYHIVAKVNIEFNPYQAQRFRDWVVVSVEKNRGGQDNVDLEFEKHFEFSCFDPNGRTVQEKLIEERLYND